MLTGTYVAGDNNNDLLIYIWLAQTAVKFALSLNSRSQLPIMVSITLKIVED